MNNTNKYFSLLLLLLGGFVSLILIIVLVFYLLKLFSVVMFNIPAFDNVFQVLILLVPYILYYAAYYYLHKKIAKAETVLSKSMGWGFLFFGSLVCTATLVLTLMVFFKMKYPWLRVFELNTHYAFIAQIIFLFATALAIASGDKKENDWMSREI